MSSIEAKTAEVEKNFQAFQELLPEIASVYQGKFAVMRDQTIDDYFDTMADAVKYGQAKYPDGLYSVQEVTRTVVDLGYFSHAGNRQAV
ncbi:MAG: hypothetical protein AAF564_22295 [Bacteroidota bacterium]